MSFQSITIDKAIKNIHERRYLLPSIQRELVWDTEKIARLFDSLLRDYPIGSFLFWAVAKERALDYQFYEFLRNYHERDATHNVKADVSGEREFTAVLDGQQRLTSLYIGLRGSYAEKIKHRRRSDADAYPPRRLHLNLSRKADHEDMLYEFTFLTDEEVREDTAIHWFPVGKILDLARAKEVSDYLKAHGLESDFASDALHRLRESVLERELVNYYQEEDQSPDKVLNIFVRVNSGGEPLGYSDLLMSIATALWESIDAREAIHTLTKELNQMGQGFGFDKDFVLKACLVLSEIPDIRYSVDNFNRKNMALIEKEWERISLSLRLAVELLVNFGFNRDSLTANNAVIPIAHYIMKRGLKPSYIQSSSENEDRRRIRRWLIAAILKGTFGARVDNVLRTCRAAVLGTTDTFPVQAIESGLLSMNITMRFEDQELRELMTYEYGQRRTFSILALLYPTLDFRNVFHQDHIHPKSLFHRKKLIAAGVAPEKVDDYKALYNALPNLQLLEGTPNQEKSDEVFESWMKAVFQEEDQRARFIERNYIPRTGYAITNFLTFFEARKNLLIEQLKKELNP